MRTGKQQAQHFHQQLGFALLQFNNQIVYVWRGGAHAARIVKPQRNHQPNGRRDQQQRARPWNGRRCEQAPAQTAGEQQRGSLPDTGRGHQREQQAGCHKQAVLALAQFLPVQIAGHGSSQQRQHKARQPGKVRPALRCIKVKNVLPRERGQRQICPRCAELPMQHGVERAHADAHKRQAHQPVAHQNALVIARPVVCGHALQRVIHGKISAGGAAGGERRDLAVGFDLGALIQPEELVACNLSITEDNCCHQQHAAHDLKYSQRTRQCGLQAREAGRHRLGRGWRCQALFAFALRHSRCCTMCTL